MTVVRALTILLMAASLTVAVLLAVGAARETSGTTTVVQTRWFAEIVERPMAYPIVQTPTRTPPTPTLIPEPTETPRPTPTPDFDTGIWMDRGSPSWSWPSLSGER